MSRVLITGANRGIGLEFTSQYLAAGWQVDACCRNPEAAADLNALKSEYSENLNLYKLDVNSEQSIASLKQALTDQAIDVLINNAGIYGPKGLEFSSVTPEPWLEVLATNTIAPLMLSQALYDNIQRGELKTIVAISSKMGSIADNEYGNSYLYRSSKSALNSVMRSMSIDLKPQAIKVVIFHPGWVQTDMGGPQALIDTNTSVTGMRKIITDLPLDKSGEFLSYDGSTLPW